MMASDDLRRDERRTTTATTTLHLLLLLHLEPFSFCQIKIKERLRRPKERERLYSLNGSLF